MADVGNGVASPPSVVEGCIIRGVFRFWCRYCRRSHFHGIGADQANPDLGKRGAHCFDPRSPYYGHGYWLKLKPRPSQRRAGA